MTDLTLHEGFPNIRIPAGATLRLTAVSPTTGAAVGGVTASSWAIYGDDDSDNLDALKDTIPHYTPEEVTGGIPA